jgi:3-oxoacyl-(acyl-carrier-protein) synthase
MAAASCLAVITGIGCVSPFGVGGQAFVAKLLHSNCTAIGPITGFATAGLSRHLGAEVPSACLPEGEEARRWSRISQMTVAACRQAVLEAGLCGSERLCQFGLVVGTEFGDLRSTEAFALGFLRKGPLGLSPLLFPNTVMNAMAGTASIALGLKGPMLTLNQPGVAGEVAVARALTLLKAGRAPAVLVCGVDELFPALYDTLGRLNMLSPCDEGEEGCWPFDVRHNGPVLGEGATALVLESPAYAMERGAPILAAVYSARCGGLPARPNGYPALRHLRRHLLDQALADATLSPADVGVAYLSGCGDPHHDAAELALLAAAFGKAGPWLTSVTHLAGAYGGLGALRLAAATATVTTGILPRLDYLRQPIRTDVRFAAPCAPLSAPVVLVHGLARGGLQTAILLGPLPNHGERAR